MKNKSYPCRLGLLGGGQLGRMLLPEMAKLAIEVHILDPDAQAPCQPLCANFVQGSLTAFDDVYAFGQGKDIITVEIENVNTEALAKLEAEGVSVYPQPRVLAIIQDKCLQKQFYKDNGIPTADFILTSTRADLATNTHLFPAVHKLGKAGYDGRGVQKINNASEITLGFDVPSVLEQLIDFEQEISIIVARNPQGEIALFPPVAQVLDPIHNLVDYLFAPAPLHGSMLAEANRIATDIITRLDMVGLLAVELFITKNGQVLVNEVAPRPHNSGHHTIEANVTSQFEQHLRAILGYPLGKTDTLQPAAMVNLLGESGYTGKAIYEGLPEILATKGVYAHLYGKTETKPQRKMGHITVVTAPENIYWQQELEQVIDKIKKTVKIIA